MPNQFKTQNVFLYSFHKGYTPDEILAFFREFVGKELEDFVVDKFPSLGLFHVMTANSDWQVVAKLTEHESILKALVASKEMD